MLIGLLFTVGFII